MESEQQPANLPPENQRAEIVITDSDAETELEDLAEDLKDPINPEKSQPPAKKAEETVYNDEGETCPICLDIWGDSGEHRLCAMKCGHLFGRSCITTWLKDNRTCPSCKKRGNKRDLRNLYCNKVIALEESAIAAVRQRLVEVEAEKAVLSSTLEQCKVQRDLLSQEVETLRTLLKNRTTQSQVINSSRFSRLVRIRSLLVSNEAGCRVLDFNTRLNAVAVSMKCASLFGNFGLCKVNMSTLQSTGIVQLHSKMIRDVKFQNNSSLLMTVSLDKTAKVVDTLTAGRGVLMYTSDLPLWSCTWDTCNSNVMYVGGQRGAVQVLDIRNLSQSVNTLQVTTDSSPAVSIATLPPLAGHDYQHGALIACQLNTVHTYSRSNATQPYLTHTLTGPACTGNYISMSATSQHILLSARANSNYPYTRHIYGNVSTTTTVANSAAASNGTVATPTPTIDHLSGDNNVVFNGSNVTAAAPTVVDIMSGGGGNSAVLNTVHSFHGGGGQALMSRSCLTDRLAAAYLESNRSVTVWSLETGYTLCSAELTAPVTDVACYEHCGKSYILTVDEKNMTVFHLQ